MYLPVMQTITFIYRQQRNVIDNWAEPAVAVTFAGILAFALIHLMWSVHLHVAGY
jgi:hypothetical protein